VSESLQFTIVYADGEDGWYVAQVKEVPGAVSQGRTRAEARENVIDALRLMLSPEPDQTAGDTEALQLTLAT
jgi:predicted RNase H-like HicB family nuclease